MKTFETLTKEEFISLVNNRKWSNWNERMLFPNENIGDKIGVGKIGLFGMYTMGFTFTESNRTIDADFMRVINEVIDIPEYDDNVLKFKEQKVMQCISDDVYVLKDNLNKFRLDIGLVPLTAGHFTKLSNLTGLKYIKTQKMFDKILDSIPKSKPIDNSNEILSKEQIKSFYHDFDYFKGDFNLLGGYGRGTRNYSINYKKNEIHTFTSNKNFEIGDAYCTTVIIDYIYNDEALLKTIKKIIDRQEKIPIIEKEIKSKNKVAIKELLDSLKECFIQFDTDNEFKTKFTVEFPQISSWEWYNEYRYTEVNPIRLDSMFDFFEVEIESKKVGKKTTPKPNLIENLLYKLEVETALRKRFIERIDFITKHLECKIINIWTSDSHGINDTIASMRASIKFGTNKLDYSIKWRDEGSGYTNLKLKS
jgi:hypothetical protein